VTDTGINGGGNCFRLSIEKAEYIVESIPEEEVVDSRGQRSVTVEVSVASDSGSRKPLIVGLDWHCIASYYMAIG